MRLDDITIQVIKFSTDLSNVGEIDKDYINDLKIVKRFNNVGSWALSLPVEYDMAQELSIPGRGIKITGPGWQVAGPMISTTHKNTTDDPTGMLSFQGADLLIHLADALAFPQPGNADPTTQNIGNDIRTGFAEAIMRQYLVYNIGDGSYRATTPTGAWATADRTIPRLRVEEFNLNRGASVRANARFDVLGQLLSDIASQGGGLGFDIRISDASPGPAKEWYCYVPTDKSSTIRMDIWNDMVEETEYGFGAPTATRAIVAGQGEGVARKFVKVTTVDSAASETTWGRKPEFFKDRRDTNDTTELTQEGTDIVTANGVMIKSLSVKPADDIANQEFGTNWFLGDKVGVIVDGQAVTSVVTEAVILIDQRGVRAGATLGDPVGFDYDAKLVQAQQDQQKRLSNVEKNAASSASVEALGTTVSARAIEVFSGIVDPNWTSGTPVVTLDAGQEVSGTVNAYLAPSAIDVQPGSSVVMIRSFYGAYVITNAYAAVIKYPKWVDLTLSAGWTWNDDWESGWSAAAGGFPVQAQYHKPQVTRLSTGYVEVAGCLKGTVGTAGTVVANIPAPFRPLVEYWQVVIYYSGSGFGGVGVQVKTNGDIVLQSTVSPMAWLFLDGIAYNNDAAMTWTNLSTIGYVNGWADSNTVGDTAPQVGMDSVGRVYHRGVLRKTGAAVVGAITAAYPNTGLRIQNTGIMLRRTIQRAPVTMTRIDFQTAGTMYDQTGLINTNTRIDLGALIYNGTGYTGKMLTPSYQNGADYGSGYAGRQLTKASDGVVSYKGMAVPNAGGRAFDLLPQGYRPAGIRAFYCNGNSTLGGWWVFPDGTTYWRLGSAWQAIDDIRFVAEQ